MTYTAPLADMRFALREIAGLERHRGPGRATSTPPMTLVDAVLGKRPSSPATPGAAQPRRR